MSFNPPSTGALTPIDAHSVDAAITSRMLLVVNQRVGVADFASGGVIALDFQCVAQRRYERTSGEHAIRDERLAVDLQRLSFELAQLEGRSLSAARRDALRRLASAQPADLRLRLLLLRRLSQHAHETAYVKPALVFCLK